MDKGMLKMALYSLREYLSANGAKNVEEVEELIMKHSLAAAAAAVASGWIPGAGGVIATGISIGFVWAMYYRLCALLDIRISKNILKTIASVIVAEVAAYVGVILAATVAVSFIPFFGNMSASVLSALMNFFMVYAAGVLFITMMAKVLKAQKNTEGMSETEWKQNIQNVVRDVDMKDLYSEAKDAHKKAKNDPKYKDYDDVKPFEQK